MDIQALVDAYLPAARELRHGLHRIPELALQEHKTARLLRQYLAALPVDVLDPFMETDTVALLHGARPGPNVTLRADIDALPLREETGVAYTSEHRGMMHACGHDGHMAMLMGAAMVLSDLHKELAGSIRFVFQPGEEITAAGRTLVEKGVLQNPSPKAVYAIHGRHDLTEGVFQARSGPMLAAVAIFKVMIHGRGGHGGRPHEAINPLHAAARVVEALTSLPTLVAPPEEPAVLSVGRVAGGTTVNAIPEEAEVAGTIRYADPELSSPVREAVERAVHGACESVGAWADLDYQEPYIATVNHAESTALGKQVAVDSFGAQAWQDLPTPSMGGEDFAFYLREHQGAMFFLGYGEEWPSLHSPHFDFNDAVLGRGMRFFAELALATLAENQAS